MSNAEITGHRRFLLLPFAHVYQAMRSEHDGDSASAVC